MCTHLFNPSIDRHVVGLSKMRVIFSSELELAYWSSQTCRGDLLSPLYLTMGIRRRQRGLKEHEKSMVASISAYADNTRKHGKKRCQRTFDPLQPPKRLGSRRPSIHGCSGCIWRGEGCWKHHWRRHAGHGWHDSQSDTACSSVFWGFGAFSLISVSYTHLTLPTIA